MVDEIKNAIARGNRTEKLYRNRDVQHVFAELKEDICILWIKTPSDQDEERERLYREMHGLKALERRIIKIINDGKKAQESIKNGN